MSFLENYAPRLQAFTTLSQSAGARPDYVQGGGGNTSVKLDDRLMAIKASGYRLNQIEPGNAYAVLDYAEIRRFYSAGRPEGDVEKSGSDAAKAATLSFPELPVLRPSVEAGFHSLLNTYVLHTHAVYANLVCCSSDGQDLLAKTFEGTGVVYAFIPYINPGAELTFEIARAIEECKVKTGQKPNVLFLQNHGFISTHDDLETCLETHEAINRQIASLYGTDASEFPPIAIQAEENRFVSATPWLREMLSNPGRIKLESYNLKFFVDDSLYPDQMVYLNGALDLRNGVRTSSDTFTSDCTIYLASGEVVYTCPEAKALTIEETLTAILYIYRCILDAGKTPITMSAAGKDFIAGWESEKYRKNLMK